MRSYLVPPIAPISALPRSSISERDSSSSPRKGPRYASALRSMSASCSARCSASATALSPPGPRNPRVSASLRSTSDKLAMARRRKTSKRERSITAPLRINRSSAARCQWGKSSRLMPTVNLLAASLPDLKRSMLSLISAAVPSVTSTML